MSTERFVPVPNVRRAVKRKPPGTEMRLRITPKIAHLNVAARLALGFSEEGNVQVLWGVDDRWTWLFLPCGFGEGLSVSRTGQFGVRSLLNATELYKLLDEDNLTMEVILSKWETQRGLLADLREGTLREPSGQAASARDALPGLDGVVSPSGRPQAPPRASS